MIAQIIQEFIVMGRRKGYAGAYLLPYCPFCKSKPKEKLAMVNCLHPNKPELVENLKGHILIYPVCTDCLKRFDSIKDLAIEVEKMVEDLIKDALKVEFA